MLIAHYPLDEDSGTTAYDHTGNGNNGTVTGATVGATGLLGGTAYSFDGTDDSVVPPDRTNSAYSIMAWFTADSFTNKGTVICYNQGDLLLRNDTAGNLEYYHRDGGSTYQLIHEEPISTATWYHTVQTWDGSTATAYIDGVSVGNQAISGLANDTTTTTAFGIGAEHPGTTLEDKHFDGRINGVRVYDHALTPAEIQYLYDVSTTGTILTASKTHGSAISPDLRANITLNAQAATASVIGSPGTASEEVQSVALSTGTNDYTLSWAATHTEFRVEVVADLADLTQRVETNRIALLT